MKKQDELTQEKLKELLHYDSGTGVFTRKVKTCGTVNIGDIAGSLHKDGRYVEISLLGKSYRAHHLSWLYMYGEFSSNRIKHINNIGSDNRIVNLIEKIKGGEVTQEKLRKLFNYDPITGVFIRKVKTTGSVIIDEVAGGIGKKGYRYISVCGKQYLAHRLAWLYMYGEWPEDQIDHEDTNKDNNAIDNLRLANNSQNQQNQVKAKKSNKSTGLLGSYYDSRRNFYYSRIVINNEKIWLGVFNTAQEAHNRYLEEKRKIHPFNTI